MADTLYAAAAQAFLDADIDMSANDIRIILIDADLYTPNFATDVFLSSVPMGARVAVSGPLTGKTTTAGVFDANDVAYGAVGPPGTTVEAVLLYQHTGVDATSRLIEWKDQLTGLPLVVNGGPVNVVWTGGFIFQIAGTCPP